MMTPRFTACVARTGVATWYGQRIAAKLLKVETGAFATAVVAARCGAVINNEKRRGVIKAACRKLLELMLAFDNTQI